MTPRRASLAVVAVAAGSGLLLGWALPSAAGRLFVEVQSHVEPVGGPASGGRSVILPDGTSAAPDRLRVVAVITNRYPLPVTLVFRGSAIEATLVHRGTTGGDAVWRTSADDPALESGDDSPDPGPDRVVVIQPGTTILPSDPGALVVERPAIDALEPGIYTLRVSAFGIAAGPTLISVIDQS